MTGSQAAGVHPLGVGPVVRLRLRQAAPVDLGRASELLGASAARWLGGELPDASDEGRRFLCDLELRAGGGGPTLFRKAAVVTLADPVRTVDGWVVPVEWRAASLSPLFPVFVGQLGVFADHIELDGAYAPPGGRVGYLLDTALLGAAARQTARWFMRRLVDALG